MTDHVNVTLVFPPHWTPTMPHLALPWLTDVLRQNGYSVNQRDLNVEFFDAVLSSRYLREALRRIRRRFGSSNSPRPGIKDVHIARPGEDQVNWALEHGGELAGQVEQAKKALRSQSFYDGDASLPAFMTISQSLEVISLAHHPAHLDFGGFTDALRPDSSDDLFTSARNPDINPFYEFFANGIIKDLVRNPPDLVGISIPTQGQFLAAITLAHLIREAGLKCHITAGGPHISMLRDQIPTVPGLFDLFDSFVVMDGEEPLLRLLQAIQQGGDYSVVPNLIYRIPGGGGIQSNPILQPGQIRQIQQTITPDFNGLPLDLYLTPDLVLPLITAHGCYYGKCAFCNVGYNQRNNYFAFKGESVVNQMRSMLAKYGCRHIFFIDEALSPRMLRLISENLAGDDQINWCGAGRFEKALTDDLVKQISAKGFSMMMFGLESASEPIMERMAKGTRIDDMSRILRSCASANIWNHTFFFFGFPGETIENAQDTVNFVYAHQKDINSASPGAFLMEIYSPAYLAPEKYGVLRIIKDARRDLAIYFDYQAKSGMDESMANRLSDRLVDQLPDKQYGQFYISDVYKFLYSSKLRSQGRALPKWIE